MKYIKNNAGSIVTDFSSDETINYFLINKPKELGVSRSSLIRFAIILAMKRLADKDSIKANKLISKTII